MSSPAETRLHPAFASALESDRETFNQRFKLRSAQGAPLDADAFLRHMRDRVNGIVSVVEGVFPERTKTCVSGLYEVSLDLFRAGIFGPETRTPSLDRLWQRTLPLMARAVAADAHSVAGSLSNAVIYLSKSDGVRLDDWFDVVEAIAGACRGPDDAAAVGRIAAWRSGLAPMRQAALDALRRLPKPFVRVLLQLDDTCTDDQCEKVIDRLQRDCWFDPAHETTDRSAAVEPVHRVGAFQGFGGRFKSLPQVFLLGQAIHVQDRFHSYRIYADRFGAGLVRVGDASLSNNSDPPPYGKMNLLMAGDGSVTWQSFRRRWAHLESSASQAFDGRTLAVTLPTSFHVYLLAVRGDASYASEATA